MVEALKVEKHTARVKLCLIGGETFEGAFFLSGQARRHSGPETVMDLLNNRENRFVPFVLEPDKTLQLLQRERIQWVEFDEEWAHKVFDQAPEGSRFAAEIRFTDHAFTGIVFTGEMPPEKRRVIDLLNGGPHFFLIREEQKYRLINRDQVNLVVLT